MTPELTRFLTGIRWQDLLDILLVSFVLYRFFLLIKGTRAVQLLRGMLLLLLAYLVSHALELNTITWLVQSMATMIIVAIPVVFQPELRRALAHIGQGEIFRGGDLFQRRSASAPKVLDEIQGAVRYLSRQKIGALIILERTTGLTEFIETGTPLDAMVTTDLLSTIFVPNTPLHDGAVIIQGDRIAAAGAVLPLSEGLRRSGPAGKRQVGTRHRAAIGLTETSDAIAIVVSEETGTVSVATGGQLKRHLTEEALKDLLTSAFALTRRPNHTQPLTTLFFARKPHATDELSPTN
ncbi:MAG: diadenylate cyclase CdaA [Candidatus Sericytochromatia bacterium]|nr:diadenylate cyclase CdaA [Candidatus Sericytochromatia bacterium]